MMVWTMYLQLQVWRHFRHLVVKIFGGASKIHHMFGHRFPHA